MKINFLNKNEFNIFQVLILLFVFLFAMNFINRYFYCVFIAFALFLLVNKKFTISFSLVALLGLSFCIIFFSKDTTSAITSYIKPFIYPICFLIGSSFFNNESSKYHPTKRENSINTIIVVIILGLLVHFLLNFAINIDNDERNTTDFWTNEVLSATGQTAIACLPIAISCAWLVSDTKLINKIFAVITLCFVLAYNLVLAGRTIIIMTGICLIASIIHLLFNGKKTKKTSIIIVVLVILAIVALLINFNAFGLQDEILNSNLYDRFYGEWAQDIDDDGRSKLKLVYLSRFFDNLWGGSVIKDDIGYAHDIYLDTYDYCGIFGLIFTIIYVIASIIRGFKVLKLKGVSFKFKQLVFCFYLVSNIEFFIEPILYGMPWFLASYCLVDGLLYSFIPYTQKNQKLLEGGFNENS